MLQGILASLGLVKQAPVEVYCQTCGKDLTTLGGAVGARGIYCHYYGEDGSRCLDGAIFEEVGKGNYDFCFIFNYHGPRQVQKAIKDGSLVNFGPLEQKTQDMVI